MAKKRSQDVTASPSLSCFIVSPIGRPSSTARKHADRVLTEIIEPALSSTGIVPKRADNHVCEPGGSIPKSIVRALHESPLCIAILTNLNPNVMFEVGVRHAWDLPMLHLAEGAWRDKLPFDIATRDTIFYSLRSAAAIAKAVDELRSRVRHWRQGFESTPVGVVPTIHELLGKSLRKLAERFSLDSLFKAKQGLLHSFCQRLRRNRRLVADDTERNKIGAKPLADFVPDFVAISHELRATVDVFEEIARTQHKDNGPRRRCEPILNRIKGLQRDLDKLVLHLENGGSADQDFDQAVSTIDAIVDKAEAIELDCAPLDS